MNARPAPNNAESGLLYGLGAYGVWGLFPLYFALLRDVAPAVTLCHRIIWSFLFLLPLIRMTGRGGRVRAALASPKMLGALSLSTLMIASNWLIFLQVVAHGDVLQSSLGYFLTPLVNVLFGCLLLGERLNPLQGSSLLLAVSGVTAATLLAGSPPWAALALAITFGTYGLIRKRAGIDPLSGLCVETALLVPVALGFLCLKGSPLPAAHPVLLPLAGVVTAIPLLLYASAVRRLRLVTIGFLQFITPSLHFFCAVFAFGESFTRAYALCFGLIWSGLFLFGLDSLLRLRGKYAALT